MPLMDTSEGTPGGETQEFTVIGSGPLAGWRLETDATAVGNMRLLRSPDGTKTLYARPGEFESGIEGAQIIPGFGAVFSPEQASAFGAKYTADNKLFGFVPDDSRLLVGGAMGIAGAGIGAHSGLFGGGAGGAGDLSYLSDAGFEFGSGGTDFLGSGLADAPWGINPQPSDLTGAFDVSGSEGVFPYESPALSEGGAMDMYGSVNSPTGAGGGGTIFQQGIGGGGMPTGTGSALSRFLSGEPTAADLASLLGSLGSTALGVLGSSAQQGAYRDVANQYLGIGAPYRDKLLASYQPGFDLRAADPLYAAALSQSADEAARAVSAKSGNPYGNPGAMAEIQQGILAKTAFPYQSNYRGQLGQFGGLGLNQSGTASMAGAGQAGGLYDALGSGLSGLTRLMQPSLEDLLQRYGGGSQGYSLNTGGGI